VPVQLTPPSSEASPRGAHCDVPGNVRLDRPTGAAPAPTFGGPPARILNRQGAPRFRTKYLEGH